MKINYPNGSVIKFGVKEKYRGADMKNTISTSFRFEREVYQKLKELAKMENVSATKFIEDLITYHGTSVKKEVLKELTELVKKYE